MKNIEFSSFSTFGFLSAGQVIYTVYWNVAFTNPQFGVIYTGIAAEVNMKNAI